MTESRRPQKKTETLEVRLPHETKRAFLDACRENGTTASEVVRESIDTYLAGQCGPAPQDFKGRLIAMIPKPVRKRRYLAGALGVAGLAVFTAMPSAAGPDFRAVFDRLDANQDGILTPDEFTSRSSSSPGKGDMIVIRRVERTDAEPGAAAPPSPAPSEKAVTYWLGDDAKAAGEGKHIVMERREIRVTTDDETGDVTTINILGSEFERFDADKDGKVSFAEYQARQQQMLEAGFHELDANRDGSLSEAEYGRIGQPVIVSVQSPETRKVITETIEGLPLAKPAELKARFAKLDANGDGKLSLQEYLPRQ